MPTVLHRFTIKPRRVEAFVPLWVREVAVRERHGFITHRAFVETDAEPTFTWLYSHPEPQSGEAAVAADPEIVERRAAMAELVFGNTLVRPVDVEVLTEGLHPHRLAIMRRYSIVGDWDAFLDVWRRIVPVRARYGFECLFAVADRPKDMFTWAFSFDGEWSDFGAAQRDYYRDPARVELRGVFDFMADYSIHPALQVPLT